jgi:Holliday junction DNA helicase RuvA
MLSPNCVIVPALSIGHDPGEPGLVDVQLEGGYVYQFRAVVSSFFDGGDHTTKMSFTPLKLLMAVYCHQGQEGVQSWYAFRTTAHRKLFIQMLEAERVGPGVALKIITNTHPDTILSLIQSGDREAFVKLKGVGPKTGAALIKVLFEDSPPQGPTKVVLDENAVATMRALGYEAKPAKESVLRATKELPEGSDTAALVRAALGYMQPK